MNDSTLRRRVSPLIRTIKTRMNSRKLYQTLIYRLVTRVIFSSTIISVNTKCAIWKHLINHGNLSPLNLVTDHIGLLSSFIFISSLLRISQLLSWISQLHWTCLTMLTTNPRHIYVPKLKKRGYNMDINFLSF